MKPMTKFTLRKFAERQQESTCSRLAAEKCGKDGPMDCPCGSPISPNRPVMNALDDFGRERLSKHYFMRDFLYSEVAAAHGIANVPDDADLAVEAGRGLCGNLLEPLHSIFGHVTIRSAFRSANVNGYCNCHGMDCSSNKASYANHVWDHEDRHGYVGATACIVIPWFVDWLEEHPDRDWRSLAWFIHDHLPYSEMVFFPENGACNLTWRCCRARPDRSRSEDPRHKLWSHTVPKGILTAPGMSNYTGRHDCHYPDFPDLAAARDRTGTLRAARHGSRWPDYLNCASQVKAREDESFTALLRQKDEGVANPAFVGWRRDWVGEVNKAWEQAGRVKGTFREREAWYRQEKKTPHSSARLEKRT
jgi:hypothetical protein